MAVASDSGQQAQNQLQMFPAFAPEQRTTGVEHYLQSSEWGTRGACLQITASTQTRGLAHELAQGVFALIESSTVMGVVRKMFSTAAFCRDCEVMSS